MRSCRGSLQATREKNCTLATLLADDCAMPVHQSVLELIGKTPIVQVQRLDTGVLRAVPQAREPESRRFDQGPHRPVDDRGRREGAGQIKPGDTLVEGTAGNTGIGLALVAQQKGYKLHPRGAGQDEPREDLQPQGDGRRGGADALGRGQGPSAVLPGPGRADRAARRRAPTSSTSSAIRTIRTRTRRAPGPRSWRRWSGKLDAIVFGVRSARAR